MGFAFSFRSVEFGFIASSFPERNFRHSRTEESYSDSLAFVRSSAYLTSSIRTKRLSGSTVCLRDLTLSSSASDRRDKASDNIIVLPGLWMRCRGYCDKKILHRACLLFRSCPDLKYRRLS